MPIRTRPMSPGRGEVHRSEVWGADQAVAERLHRGHAGGAGAHGGQRPADPCRTTPPFPWQPFTSPARSTP
uniref:Uncharacterized protein n=1 Tax=Anguilla anguilla TaxID=7936 RepID=A0A0E9QZ70_ANGAN